jgi:hypothetical protein
MGRWMGMRSGLNALERRKTFAPSCILPHMDLRHFIWFCKNLNSSVAFVSDSNRIHDSNLILLLSVTAVYELVL